MALPGNRSSTSLLLPLAITLAASLAAAGLSTFSNNQNELSPQASVPASISTLFSKWKATYGIHYSSPVENTYRMGTFYQNYLSISQFRRANPEATYGLNIFSDRTFEEFKSTDGNRLDGVVQQRAEVKEAREKYLTVMEELKNQHQDQYKIQLKSENLKQGILENSEDEEKIDYRHRVSRVKDQGVCGACWAFSASSAIEANFSASIEISPQFFLDCSSCNCNEGGHELWDTKSVLDLWGYKVEADSPYLDRKSKCLPIGAKKLRYTVFSKENVLGFDAVQNIVQNKRVEVKEPLTISEIYESLKEHGPLSTSMRVEKSFIFYTGGVYYDEKACTGSQSNHAVLLIGSDRDHWYIQNSIGTKWGENGIFKVKKNRGDLKTSKDYCFCGGAYCSIGTFKLR